MKSQCSILLLLLCCTCLPGFSGEYNFHALKPYALIDDQSNFQYINSVTVTQKGTFLISVTAREKLLAPGESVSGNDSFYVYTRRSEDRGKTWQPRVTAYRGHDAGEDYNAEMGQLFPVPAAIGPEQKLRIYQFHIRRHAPSSIRFGKLAYSFSEDDGRSWTGPRGPGSVYMIPEPKGYTISQSKDGYGWHLMGPPIIMSNGQFLLPLNISTDPEPLAEIHSEIVFMISRNIFTETDPAAVTFHFYPAPPDGIKSPLKNERQRTLAQEPQVVELSDHRIMCVFRTGNGRVEYAVSQDFARTWTNAQPLRYYPQKGPEIKNPNCACPFTKLSNGTFALLHTNNDGYMHGSESPFDGRKNRHPIYVTIGKELTADNNQPMMFTASRILCSMEGFHPENPRRDLTYGALVESEGEFFHYYNALWNYIQVNKVAPSVLRFR